MSEAPAPTHGALTSEQEYRLRNYAVGFDHLGWQNVKHSDVAALLAAYDAQAARLAELEQLRRFGLDDIQTLCGIISHSGPNGEPLACGYQLYHEGAHSWATLPTFGAAGAGEL